MGRPLERGIDAPVFPDRAPSVEFLAARNHATSSASKPLPEAMLRALRSRREVVKAGFPGSRGDERPALARSPRVGSSCTPLLIFAACKATREHATRGPHVHVQGAHCDGYEAGLRCGPRRSIGPCSTARHSETF